MTFNMSEARKLCFSHIRKAILSDILSLEIQVILSITIKVISDATPDEVYFINREKNRQVFKNLDYYLLDNFATKTMKTQKRKVQ